MKNNVLALVAPPSREPNLKDGDGEEGGEAHTSQVVIDTAENGFILSVHGNEEVFSHRVYPFKGKDEYSPRAMIEEVINALGLSDQVKLK